ncbi:C40 family peptidase [Sporosarcina sp. FSL K6-3508]|uniref:C40 family peptidase n=1 Tax=Sporosarcina sp. FSL K6-3508 TaxID=2921557 RepID=UPI00315A9DF8
MPVNERWVCAVSAATVWSDPNSPRLVDLPALNYPVQLEKWLAQLSFEERLALSDKGQIQTQILYGESVIIDEVVGDWAKVIACRQPSRKDPRGYPGWVPLVQLSAAKKVHTEEFVRVSARKAWVLEKSGDPFLRVSFNTIFPCGAQQADRTHIWTPHGWKLISNADVKRFKPIEELSCDKPLTVGKQFLGLPYLWGGMSAWGFDCSGFIFNLWKACGVLLPRDASDQEKTGRPVSLNQTEWRQGDLLFFREEEDAIVSHVGMYAGNGQMLHAPSTGKSVEQIQLASSVYADKLCRVRRVCK